MEKKISLGYINSWGDNTPEIYLKCRDQNHQMSHREVGRCLMEYSCEICGYYFKVDSSD